MWLRALDISEAMLVLCEGFSHTDQNFLAWQLRNTAIEIPAAIGADKLHRTKTAIDPILKGIAAIELVHRIYPAMETGTLPEQLKELLIAAKGK